MTGKEKIIISDESIEIPTENEYKMVMHIGEKSLMEKLANLISKNGGDILEIGFGMHLSADAIQSNPNVKSHTIIEVHPEIYELALIWAKNKKNVKVILGDWIKVLPLEDKKFDGILHDTHIDPNILKFLNHIKDNCKINTIVGFFDYPDFDTRFNSVRYEIDKLDFETIPYNDNISFNNNQYELKYTIFDGIDFKVENKIKSII